MSKKTVLITDLDNTLFDWVDLWHNCFVAMMKSVEEISGIPFEELKPDIRSVHRRHGTSEYSFLIEELPQLRSRFPREELTTVFAPAIRAYREERRKRLVLYPTVAETLLRIKGTGAIIVGYTESMAFYSNYRVRRLGLDGVFDFIFSPADHDIPPGVSVEDLRKYPASYYKFKYTKHEHTPRGSLKPNADVLLDIVSKVGADVSQCVYVGDSLQKDIAMARTAGVTDLYARYGKAQDTAAYQLLREVTHWSDEDVQREKEISERIVVPGITLDRCFAQILEHVEFGGPGGQRSA